MNPKTIKATQETVADLVSCGELVLGTIPYNIDALKSKLINYQINVPNQTVITGKVTADSVDVSSVNPVPIQAQYVQTSQFTPVNTSDLSFVGNVATTTLPNSTVVPTLTCSTECNVVNNVNTTTKYPYLVGVLASNLASGTVSILLGKDFGTSFTIAFNYSGTSYIIIANKLEVYPLYVNVNSGSLYIDRPSNPTALKPPTTIVSTGIPNTITASAVSQSGISIPANTREIVITVKDMESTAVFLGVQFSISSTFSNTNMNYFKMSGVGFTSYDTDIYAPNYGGLLDTYKWMCCDHTVWGNPIFFPTQINATRIKFSGIMRFIYMGLNTSNQEIWNMYTKMSSNLTIQYWHFSGSMISDANRTASYLRICMYKKNVSNTDTVSGRYQITFF